MSIQVVAEASIKFHPTHLEKKYNASDIKDKGTSHHSPALQRFSRSLIENNKRQRSEEVLIMKPLKVK